MPVPQSILQSVPLRWLLRLRYEYLVRRTDRWRYWGAFETYEAAEAAAPRRRDMGVGYDTEGMATLGTDDYSKMHPFDYPVVYWLGRWLAALQDRTSLSVVDLGGHLGEKYAVYDRYLQFPATLRWTVCETTDAVGEAERRGLASETLVFTTDRRCLDGADIVLASGSIQYLRESPWQILDSLKAPPGRILINKVPLASGPDVWTLQNAWSAIVPYRVFNRQTFESELAGRGYRAVDQWDVPQRSVTVPYTPGVGTDRNAGLALERDDDAQ